MIENKYMNKFYNVSCSNKDEIKMISGCLRLFLDKGDENDTQIHTEGYKKAQIWATSIGSVVCSPLYTLFSNIQKVTQYIIYIETLT